MDRRRGAETFVQLQGVSKASKEAYDKAEDLFRLGKNEEAMPFLRKALEDPNNLDARIGLAQYASSDLRTSINILKSAEVKGRENLIKVFGDKCFDDDGEQVGEFWQLIDTRPYMRVLKMLTEMYNMDGKYKKACDIFIEMMRLCHQDNQANRTWLAPLLCRVGRWADALYFVQARLKAGGDGDKLKLIKSGIDFKEPARNFVPEEKEDCSFLHTAALASFKLWGNCTESRRYLRIAARSNQLVLLKILGGVKQPSNPKSGGRSFNGAEDANDYLFLVQDLWMAPDVWMWANSDPEVKRVILKKCSRKGCNKVEVVVAEFKRCSACHLVYYCSSDCQSQDWQDHKPACNRHKDYKKWQKMFQGGAGVSLNHLPTIMADAAKRSFQIAEQLFSQGKQEAAWPYMRKALEDENNLDARIGFAILLSKDKKTAVTILRSAEVKGKENLIKQFGPKCFDDNGELVGRFWAVLDTRPYMRVLKNLAEIYNDNKQYKESAEVTIEMLRLCPGDNLSNRTWLGTLLLRIDRNEDALHFAQARLRDGPENYASLIRGGTNFKPPVKKLIPKSEEGGYEYSPGAILYTAALASFRLWGDCPESQQYLRLAARCNPLVLLKILGKIRQPEKANHDPRVLNGPEDAHDYLWLSQDLWMKSDVWNWANDNPDVKKAVLKKCSKSGCEKVETTVAEFKRCAACHKVYYCDANSQSSDWKNHKPACRQQKEIKVATRRFQQGKDLPKNNPIPMVATDFGEGFAVMEGPGLS